MSADPDTTMSSVDSNASLPTAATTPSHHRSHPTGLSPPNSQERPHPAFPVADDISMMDTVVQSTDISGTGEHSSNVKREGTGNGGATGAGAIEDEKEPGWAWKNKQAMEDYHRAMEAVVDKKFSLKEFGDLFGEGAASESG